MLIDINVKHEKVNIIELNATVIPVCGLGIRKEKKSISETFCLCYDITQLLVTIIQTSIHLGELRNRISF